MTASPTSLDHLSMLLSSKNDHREGTAADHDRLTWCGSAQLIAVNDLQVMIVSWVFDRLERSAPFLYFA